MNICRFCPICRRMEKSWHLTQSLVVLEGNTLSENKILVHQCRWTECQVQPVKLQVHISNQISYNIQLLTNSLCQLNMCFDSWSGNIFSIFIINTWDSNRRWNLKIGFRFKWWMTNFMCNTCVDRLNSNHL